MAAPAAGPPATADLLARLAAFRQRAAAASTSTVATLAAAAPATSAPPAAVARAAAMGGGAQPSGSGACAAGRQQALPAVRSRAGVSGSSAPPKVPWQQQQQQPPQRQQQQQPQCLAHADQPAEPEAEAAAVSFSAHTMAGRFPACSTAPGAAAPRREASPAVCQEDPPRPIRGRHGSPAMSLPLPPAECGAVAVAPAGVAAATLPTGAQLAPGAAAALLPQASDPATPPRLAAAPAAAAGAAASPSATLVAHPEQTPLAATPHRPAGTVCTPAASTQEVAVASPDCPPTVVAAAAAAAATSPPAHPAPVDAAAEGAAGPMQFASCLQSSLAEASVAAPHRLAAPPRQVSAAKCAGRPAASPATAASRARRQQGEGLAPTAGAGPAPTPARQSAAAPPVPPAGGAAVPSEAAAAVAPTQVKCICSLQLCDATALIRNTACVTL